MTIKETTTVLTPVKRLEAANEKYSELLNTVKSLEHKYTSLLNDVECVIAYFNPQSRPSKIFEAIAGPQYHTQNQDRADRVEWRPQDVLNAYARIDAAIEQSYKEEEDE